MQEENEKRMNFQVMLKKVDCNLLTGEVPIVRIGEYYLAIESDKPVSDLEKLVTHRHVGIKIASPGVIDVVVGDVLPAISLTKVSLPYEYDYYYEYHSRKFHFFELDMTNVYWKAINHEKMIAVYIPDWIPYTEIKMLGNFREIEEKRRITTFTVTNNLTGEEERVKVDKYTFETPILIGSGEQCDLVLQSAAGSVIFEEHVLLGHMGHHTYMRTKRDVNGKIPKAVNEYGHLKYEEGDRRFSEDEPFQVGHYSILMY